MAGGREMESLMRQTSVDGSLSGSDEQIEAMMQEHFGPKLSGRQETAHERTARGLRQLEDLHSIEGAPPIRWSHQCLNHAPARRIAPPLCFACGAEGAKSACAKCVVARYCTRECQVADWKARHKQGCAAFKTLGVAQKFADAVSAGSATDALVGKMRLYAFPFAIQSLRTAGRGFVFLQSDTSLDVLSLPTGSPPIDCAGRPLVQVHRSPHLCRASDRHSPTYGQRGRVNDLSNMHQSSASRPPSIPWLWAPNRHAACSCTTSLWRSLTQKSPRRCQPCCQPDGPSLKQSTSMMTLARRYAKFTPPPPLHPCAHAP